MSAAATETRPIIVTIGGFLGAGKTSLILAAARLLARRGLRSAVVLNDQGVELVDTRLAENQAMAAGEVTGGCFCCNFSALMEAIEQLRAHQPDVIFTEPVGSCTDISATVLGPLLEQFESYRVAPLTVLVDPERAAALLANSADPDLAFLFQKQLEEADLVCLSKSDLHPDAQLPGIAALRLSALTGDGLEVWMNSILSGSIEPGGHTLDIDYTRYAEAEAALAWLNLSFDFEPAAAISPTLVVGPLVDGIDAALTAAGVVIVHMKVFCNSASGWIKAAVCANGEEPRVEGMLDASPAGRHEVLLNLRAKGSAAAVRQIVEEQVARLDGKARNLRLDCFHPAPPKPERRITRPRTSPSR